MWSDLFLLPFLTGLGLALVLPVLGCFLRLRDEWLAALAYAHVAAAGALLALSHCRWKSRTRWRASPPSQGWARRDRRTPESPRCTAFRCRWSTASRGRMFG